MNDQKPTIDSAMPGTLAQPKVMRDIVLVALPIIVLGVVGNVIGVGTLTGGAIINLGYVLAIIVGALVHFAEGPVGILSNGSFALLFGWIYLKSDRNLWITCIGHGLINSLRFMLLYGGAQ